MVRRKINTVIFAAAIFFALFSGALGQTAAPKETNKREADLIELIKLDKTIKLDIKYATADNFVGNILI